MNDSAKRRAEFLRGYLHEGEDCPVCGGYYSPHTVLPLTERQTEVLEFWLDFRSRRGVWPTLLDGAQHFELSRPSIHRHLVALRDKGYAQGPQVAGSARGWTMLRRPPARRTTGPPEAESRP